jgi:hypothetical protein
MISDPELERELAPADSRFAWPLWVGKRWVSHFVRKVPGAGLPVLATYQCDARERITVPAGTFDCWRIWRRARPATEGKFLVGWVVRRLDDGVLLELEEFHRQR